MKSWILNTFYKSFLGTCYLNFLLFLDRRNSKKAFLSPKEVTQIIKEYSLLHEGVTVIKKKINTLVQSKTKDEYEKALAEIEDLTSQANYDESHPKAKFVTMLRSKMDFSNKDIKTSTDYAKMIDKRLKDYEELHSHIAKRNQLREQRKRNKNGI